MLRRYLVVLPLAGILAALAGAASADRPVLAAAGAGVVGLGIAGWLAASAERRVHTVADRVLRFAEGDTKNQIEPAGSAEWQRLVGALNAVGESLQQRFDELAGERERVERLLDAQPSAILLFTDDRLAYANPAARDMFDLGGQAWRTPVRVLGVQALADAVAESRETGAALEVEVQRDERQLVGRAAVAAPGEVVLVVTDLTETRRLDAIRRDFVTNASHELKTPVAGIQALADSLVLALHRDPARARKMVDRLQQEAARLAQLVRDLLDLARLEEVAAQRGRRRVDLTEIVRVQVDRLAQLAEGHGVALDVDAQQPAIVVAMPEDLRLIAANLLENAVQYNRPGGTVSVTTMRHAGEVVLEVTDTGVGIPESDRDRIFERFYRVDKARSRAAGGTGLGLALVRHAAQRQGGDVTVRSVLGEGSTFRVVLPVEGS